MAAANFAQGFTSSIGGGHFTGNSVIGDSVFGIGGFIDILSRSTNNADSSTVSLDVADWMIKQTFENKPLECSGLLGATDARLTGYSYSFQCQVITDISSPPDILFRGGNVALLGRNSPIGVKGCELRFFVGSITGLVNLGHYTTIEERFYWSPDAVIETATPVVDANGKKMNRIAIAGRFRSHVFLCPDHGKPTDDTSIAGAYAKWYKAKT